MEAAVRFQIDGPVALVTLDSPQNRNRIGPTAVAELEGALADAESNPAVRVIILRAVGNPFSDGMDLSALLPEKGPPDSRSPVPPSTTGGPDTGTSGAALAHQAIAGYSRVLRALSEARSPTLCVLDAPVRAGGVGLVAACDIVLATERASLELSEVRFGLIPANVLPYLLRWRMSPQKARYLVLTARRLSATEAADVGLVDEVCSSETLEKEVRALVKGLLRSSPSALEAGKRATAEWADLSRSDAIERAVGLLESLVTDPTTQADIARLESGDLPPWFAAYKPGVPLALPPQGAPGPDEGAGAAAARTETGSEER